jgi:single-stranded-DNA-specific exonuclease
MPLVSENRVLVSYGLKRLEQTDNVGLQALISACGLAGKELSASSVAFALAPRINACGRMGSPMTAERLLLTPDYGEAAELASFLCSENTTRQETEGLILQQALDLLEGEELPPKTVIVLAKEGWNHGVLGIVASRLVELFYLPVILLSVEGDCCKGSCRSIEGFNIFEALGASSHLLEKFGGHEMAAGLSLKTKNIELLQETLREYATQNMPDEILMQKLRFDAFIGPGDINLETAEQLSRFEPYGVGNPTPLFALCGAQIKRITPLSGGKHLRLELSVGGTYIQGLYFGMTADGFEFSPGDTADFAVALGVNEYRGVKSPQVIIRDMRKAGSRAEALRQPELPAM